MFKFNGQQSIGLQSMGGSNQWGQSLRDPHELTRRIQCCNSPFPASVYSGARSCATVLLSISPAWQSLLVLESETTRLFDDDSCLLENGAADWLWSVLHRVISMLMRLNCSAAITGLFGVFFDCHFSRTPSQTECFSYL